MPALLLSLVLLPAAPVLAQDTADPGPPAGAAPQQDDGPDTSAYVSVNQDTFFGFYSVAGGGVALQPGLDFTFYTIIWTTPSFAANAPTGFGLWTEFGAGVSLSLLNDMLSVAPQLGILNGVLLSGSPRALAFEGIVPNITIDLGLPLIEAQIYAGYYWGLRDERMGDPNHFLHYWANAGFRALPWLSFGVHWEQLLQTNGAGDAATVYAWIGGYAQMDTGPVALRFSAGIDVEDQDAASDGLQLGDFYKANVVVSFD